MATGITLHRIKLRLDKAIRLSTEFATAVEVLQMEMGELFSRHRARPLAERNRRMAELLRINPDLVPELRAVAAVLAEARAKFFDPRPDGEAWLKRQVSDLEWPTGE
jgi:hypothetical protein